MRLLTPFAGAVLAGGGSTRMGTDKAFLVVPTSGHPQGVALVTVARDALAGAGASEVLSVGGDLDRLRELGFDARPDTTPDAGPLGGLLTALRSTTLGMVVILTCDLPAITPDEVRGLLQTLDGAPDALVAVGTAGGRHQILTAAYRRSAYDLLEARFERGERSVRRALAGLDVVVADHLDPNCLVDLDSPEAVENYAQMFRRTVPGSDPAN